MFPSYVHPSHEEVHGRHSTVFAAKDGARERLFSTCRDAEVRPPTSGMRTRCLLLGEWMRQRLVIPLTHFPHDFKAGLVRGNQLRWQISRRLLPIDYRVECGSLRINIGGKVVSVFNVAHHERGASRLLLGESIRSRSRAKKTSLAVSCR